MLLKIKNSKDGGACGFFDPYKNEGIFLKNDECVIFLHQTNFFDNYEGGKFIFKRCLARGTLLWIQEKFLEKI